MLYRKIVFKKKKSTLVIQRLQIIQKIYGHLILLYLPLTYGVIIRNYLSQLSTQNNCLEIIILTIPFNETFLAGILNMYFLK